MSDKPVTWAQGIAVVGGAFGLCCMGFMLLHSMILSDKAYASAQLSEAMKSRTEQINRLEDSFLRYEEQNTKDHKEIILLLRGIK